MPSGIPPKHMRRKSKHTDIDRDGCGDRTLAWPSEQAPASRSLSADRLQLSASLDTASSEES